MTDLPLYYQLEYQLNKIMKKLLFILFPLIILNCSWDDNDLVRTFTYESEAISGPAQFLVFVPQREKAPVPVLYFLNNLGETVQFTEYQLNWQKKANDYGIIIVIISGESNIFRNDQGQYSYDYEDYVLEIIEIVDETFLTKNGKYYRGITGNGTGGGGALSIAKNNPDIFSSVSAMSAIFHGYDFTNINNFSDFEIYMTIGDRDINLDDNITFESRLNFSDIDHTFNILSGTHNWVFWSIVIEDILKFHVRQFEIN